MPKMMKAKPGVGAMDTAEYNAAREKLGLTVVGAGRRFEMAKRRAQRLASGEATAPPMLAILLRIMVKHNIKPEDLERYGHG